MNDSNNSYKVIDLNFLHTFTQGDEQRMSRYIGMFLQGAPEGIASMKKYYAAKEWESLKSAAHSLKPQIGYMGIESLKEIIMRLEEYAREERRLDEVPALIDQVERICTDAFSELEDARAKLG